MKKLIAVLIAVMLVFGMVACAPQTPPAATNPPVTTETVPPGEPQAPDAATPDDKLIKVGIVNNPPAESGYRAANVADFEKVFTEANGYAVSTFYSLKNDEQLNAAGQFVTDGVDYLLISAAATDGWDAVLASAQEAGIKVFLFDRMLNADESLYEAAIVSDMAQEGVTAVGWLKAQNLDSYQVIHIQGAMGSDAQIGRTAALDAEFAAGTMTKVVQQTATWDEAEAKKIVEAVINSGDEFNVIYAENDGMAKGAVAALDEAGITHGVGKDVIIMGFDCNKWALRELLAGNWNYDGQCSPFQASVIDEMIKKLEAGGTITEKKVISEERGFDATTITQADIDTYGLGE
ncbi:MAG: substrate-binding domain-containing protein [Clostridiales bacterium]|jgi:simple sugar transport system substrate-binding protein|nr:substrate-binding domain-containing protein [Clostridiales bacterium]